jgi:hypothetical protein
MPTDLNTKPTSSDAYVYVLVREDLPTEQQLVQVGHAAWEMALRLGSKGLAPREVCNLVVARVANRAALQAASQRLWEADIDHELFYEPDREMGHSALCTRPVRSRAEREVFRRYPLWKNLTTPFTLMSSCYLDAALAWSKDP